MHALYAMDTETGEMVMHDELPMRADFPQTLGEVKASGGRYVIVWERMSADDVRCQDLERMHDSWMASRGLPPARLPTEVAANRWGQYRPYGY